ncbi:hypothetical protein [Algoriphagus sp. PAP.12]|uniref:hypothetical protein n=1 Tax=Algoriphagus sp. PAP.12 TaxID=2996678 RepID=UPI00227C3F4D|nr:hypothetical protein [Algoriphagus sp. PAP.12]
MSEIINQYQAATSLADKRFLGETEAWKDSNNQYHSDKDSRKWVGIYQGSWVNIETEKQQFIPQLLKKFMEEGSTDYKTLCDELNKVYYPATEDLGFDELSKTLLKRHEDVKSGELKRIYYTNSEKIMVCNFAEGERVTQKMIKEKFKVSAQTLTSWQNLKKEGKLK